MDCYLNAQHEFVMEAYDQEKPFSSFLPGIAGLTGIPLWAFYTNRGQGISSFGIEDKNSPMMEFFPANAAYQYVSTYGFRSFLKIKGQIVEPFAPTRPNPLVARKMAVGNSRFSLEECNRAWGFVYKVTYFGLPNDRLGALVRKVEITALEEDLAIELLDGMAAVIPYGITNSVYKEMSNLMRSWMEVTNLANHVPFFSVRASIADEAEVTTTARGHFYLSFIPGGQPIRPIVDPKLVFGENTSLNDPTAFATRNLADITQAHQIKVNKVPCAFTPVETTLAKGKPFVLNTIIGHAESLDLLNESVTRLVQPAWLDIKSDESRSLIEAMLADIETRTGQPVFDAYIQQSYLDNLLRGGYPILLKGGNREFVYHVYARKHGDPEREYNFFKLAPEYYSTGEGNFRDVNQNRRSDVYFTPAAGLYNIRTFMNLLQLDGYNPLVVQGSEFVLENAGQVDELVRRHVSAGAENVVKLLKGRFTPGKLINITQNQRVRLITDQESFVKDILDHAVQTQEARHGEGFWSDHFTYNLDLIEAYLDIFPDQLETLLFKDNHYRFFESIESVVPRSKKYVVDQKGQVRQYGAVVKDTQKIERLALKANGANWVKTAQGEIFETTLYSKLLTLAIVKFSMLDPLGMGIEMEGNKPGWNDAMNGLPGLFGSGLGETFELQRILLFLKAATERFGEKTAELPIEVAAFANGLINKLTENLDDFAYWDAAATLREDYREQVRYGVQGERMSFANDSLQTMVNAFLARLETGIEKAKAHGGGLYPTFFRYEAETCDRIVDADGQAVLTHYGLPAVRVRSFRCVALPFFLEGPARYMKTACSADQAREIHQRVKASGIFDTKLKMYKTSASLEQENHEIGRIKAFTPGWLERESVFLHMTYKYLLGLLTAGLYDDFFEAMKTNFVPFMDPSVYGRSILENSSFLASSVNPDPDTHGQGFVSRLSGSNAEVISIWYKMMIGQGGFRWDKTLSFMFAPILPADWFDESGKITFRYLSRTQVTYLNQTGRHTYGDNPARPVSCDLYIGDEKINRQGALLDENDALQLRDGKIDQIVVTFA